MQMFKDIFTIHFTLYNQLIMSYQDFKFRWIVPVMNTYFVSLPVSQSEDLDKQNIPCIELDIIGHTITRDFALLITIYPARPITLMCSSRLYSSPISYNPLASTALLCPYKAKWLRALCLCVCVCYHHSSSTFARKVVRWAYQVSDVANTTVTMSQLN